MQDTDFTYRRPAQWEHADAVASIHLYLQIQRPDCRLPDARESERQIRHNIAIHGNDHNDIHVPDGIVNKTQAIECELTSKSLKDTIEVMKKLLKQYSSVIYVVNRHTEGIVRRALAEVEKKCEHPQSIQIIPLKIVYDSLHAHPHETILAARKNPPPEQIDVTTTCCPALRLPYLMQLPS